MCDNVRQIQELTYTTESLQLEDSYESAQGSVMLLQ